MRPVCRVQREWEEDAEEEEGGGGLSSWGIWDSVGIEVTSWVGGVGKDVASGARVGQVTGVCGQPKTSMQTFGGPLSSAIESACSGIAHTALARWKA